ncbi:helix-turn-helix domain-containing protein [Paenibacillus wynnii]|uniref:helix-turn-helix domain-containing protein n=1 Tax=Paenibacillus wynnii TaxID=268407 RepID=UPI0027921626|nr:helix-turn-helix transcriptional regulator [Paenibacillus wynnii]MDQ0195834.1 transcriptional regulator with XRE-family HTH domain [Paenibacillus wynnii]
MTLGEKIKSIRKINKFNQSEFSKKIGITQGTLSELETDKYLPSLDTILSLKSIFGVDLEWLLFDISEKKSNEVFMSRIDENELNLILDFRKLHKGDKREISEIIKLKINFYSET